MAKMLRVSFKCSMVSLGVVHKLYSEGMQWGLLGVWLRVSLAFKCSSANTLSTYSLDLAR